MMGIIFRMVIMVIHDLVSIYRASHVLVLVVWIAASNMQIHAIFALVNILKLRM